MKDNDIFTHLRSALLTGFAARSMTVGVIQAEQPTQQGLPSGMTVTMQMMGPTPVGMPRKADVPQDAPDTGMVHTETQWLTSTIQFNALVRQDPEDITLPTSSDLLLTVRTIFQEDRTLDSLKAVGLNILQPREARNPYFRDERGRNQASPSFDLVVTHQDSFSYVIPAAVAVDYDIKRV